MRILSIPLLVGFIAVSSLIAAAQTPLHLNIISVKIFQEYGGGVTTFEMRAVDDSQNIIQYSSADSSVIVGDIPYAQGCRPCSPPKTFNTNVFGNSTVLRANLGQSSGQVKIYVTSSESDSLFINQLVLSKKRNFFLKGATRLTGKVEVTNQSDVVIAYDNAVNLTGQYTIEFSKPYISPAGRKLIDFRSLLYSLEDSSPNS